MESNQGGGSFTFSGCSCIREQGIKANNRPQSIGGVNHIKQ